MKKTVLPFQSRYKAHERQDSRTVPLSVSGQYQTDYGSMGAGLVISTLPTLVLYMCMSSQVQRSLVAGAVKG